MSIAEPTQLVQLLELARLATGAQLVEIVFNDQPNSRWFVTESELGDSAAGVTKLEAPRHVPDTTASPDRAGCAPWVGSFVAVPLTGPSAESGVLVAAHAHADAFDATVALGILGGFGDLIEDGLDLTIEHGELAALSVRLRDLKTELSDTKQQLEVSNQELEQFAYIAAHELVAPLRSVAVYAEVLEGLTADEPLAASRRKDCVGEIRAGVQRMTQQVQYLLTLSSAQIDVADVRAIEISEVVQAAMDTLSAPLAEVNAHVDVEDLPVVMANSIPLQSVFANLLSNAIRYRHPDRDLVISITSSVTDRGPRVVVTDNGLGVAESERGRIFQLFERASTTEAGAGIGLSVSRRILEGFSATIGVDETASGGSAFWIQFPNSIPVSTTTLV